jgi:hypothetical protein
MNHRKRTRVALARRPKWAWTFRDGGVRKRHSRNDTEYLLSSPANAKWIFDAIEELRSARARFEHGLRQATDDAA